MATLTVGASQQYATVSAAVSAARDGDLVQVQAGTYVNDFATVNAKITLQAVGGMVKLEATVPLPNDKGILVTNTDLTIDGFEFAGAQGPSGNGAGIRYQGGALSITDSYFHDNQNGLLANPVANGTITIRNSEFAKNGSGDGYTHNLYVGKIARLTIEDSYFHDADVGHQIKSRALETIVTGSRIYDNASTSSYSIDLPNGGRAVISGNVIEQGANGDNPNIIAFGAEGGLHAGSTLSMTGNTVVNHMGRGAVLWNAGGAPASIQDTRTWGVADAQVASGSGVTVSGTIRLAADPALDTSHPWSTGGGSGGWSGTEGSDLHVGGAAGESLRGLGGADTLHGGGGADTVEGGEGVSYLRGDDGADSLVGGSAFDDLNGNAGDDWVAGGGGDDWVVGGRDHDRLFGGVGGDIVYGNLGDDTCAGEAGDDLVRGGQGADVLLGGEGRDWLSGDRADDTLTGGAGADIFHTFGEAGLDRVTDFSLADGDRVQIDPGVAWSVAQIGADVVVTMDGGGRLVLAGVSVDTLTPGWLFVA